MTTYNPDINHVTRANNFDERRDIVRVNLRPYVNALNVDAPNEQNQDTSSTVCCGCINTRREFAFFICYCIALIGFVLLIIISSVSITLLVVNSNENDNSTDSINSQSTGKSLISEEDMPVNDEENDISIHSPNIESTIAIEPEDALPSISSLEPEYSSIIVPDLVSSIEEDEIEKSIPLTDEPDTGTYYVNKGNIDEFEENIYKFINEYEVIIFEEDVDTLSIDEEVTINKDIEMKSTSGSKLSINCPDTGKRLFTIKEKAFVKFSGFEILRCTNLNESLFVIEEESTLTFEKMEFNALESNEGVILIESYDSNVFMDEIYFGYNDLYRYGFYFENTKAEIKNSDFISNKIYSVSGAIIRIKENSEIYFENILFDDNELDSAISVIDARDSSITMKNVEAKDNKINFGFGGFADFKSCKINITNSIFHKNKVVWIYSGGGCLYMYKSDVILHNVTMSENESDSSGGAVYIDNSILKIEESEFSANSAINSGEALYLHKSSCDIKNSLFKANKAKYGSCFTLSTDSSFYAETSEFTDNIADYGKIGYIRAKSNQKVTLKDCILKNNTGNENEDLVYEEYKNQNKISINE